MIQVVGKNDFRPSRPKSVGGGGVPHPRNFWGQSAHIVSRSEKSATSGAHHTLISLRVEFGKRTRRRDSGAAAASLAASVAYTPFPISTSSPGPRSVSRGTVQDRSHPRFASVPKTVLTPFSTQGASDNLVRTVSHQPKFWCPTQKTCPRKSFLSTTCNSGEVVTPAGGTGRATGQRFTRHHW